MAVTFPIDCLDCGGKLFAFGACPQCEAQKQQNANSQPEASPSPDTEVEQEMIITIVGSESHRLIQLQRAMAIKKMGFIVRVRMLTAS